ncbi:MAG: energy transducer TonB [Candidatus Auribacterota bacterium]|nr:energy transducer TonB [Candidatus Auribacterota bacterium]
MKKSGRNIFIAALLISAVLHIAAYCSMNIYTGWRARYLQSTDAGAEAPLIEIGLIKVSESSVQEQFSSGEPEKPELMETVEEDSEVMPDRLPREIELVSDRESDQDRKVTVPEKTGPAYPEGRAGVSRSTGGSSPDEYLAGVRRRIARSIFYPRRARLSHLEGVVKVSFLIGKEGSLEGFKVVETSPHTIFNQAARTILEKAAPFPPPGSEIVGREITVPIKFESTY